ncbi:MAG TPA: OsmC family protein [Steroidobacteraceae bacterium]|nr:OsmC family protein [Steroidobacteraceae bacterium]
MAIKIVRDQTALMRHEVRVGSHVFAADASIDDGGEGLGPNPHDLYDSALGACEALTVLWHAKRKGIPVENIEVTVERDQSEERSGIYRLDTKLKLGGKLTDEQRRELLAVASKCPIHKLMTSVQTVIATLLVD